MRIKLGLVSLEPYRMVKKGFFLLAARQCGLARFLKQILLSGSFLGKVVSFRNNNLRLLPNQKKLFLDIQAIAPVYPSSYVEFPPLRLAPSNLTRKLPRFTLLGDEKDDLKRHKTQQKQMYACMQPR